MARTSRQLVILGHRPLPRVEVARLERHVPAPAELVDEQVPAVLGVGLDHRGPLAAAEAVAGAITLTDALRDQVVVGVPQLGGLLGGDELPAGRVGGIGALVLGEPVVRAVVADDRGVDHRVPGVDPHLRLAERAEVPRGRIHHPVVGVAGVPGIVVGVQGGRPVDDVGTDRLVVVGLGRPHVARVLRRHPYVTLLGPGDEVGRGPHLDVPAAVSLGLVPVAVAVHAQVGGDEIERVPLGRADEERIAHALLPLGRTQHGLTTVHLVPVQWVVAPAGAQIDLLAVGVALPGEVAEQVPLVRRRFGKRRHGQCEPAFGLPVAEPHGRRERHRGGLGAVLGAAHLPGGGDHPAMRGFPRHRTAVQAGRRQGEVAADVVGAVHDERLGGLGDPPRARRTVAAGCGQGPARRNEQSAAQDHHQCRCRTHRAGSSSGGNGVSRHRCRLFRSCARLESARRVGRTTGRDNNSLQRRADRCGNAEHSKVSANI